MSVIVKGMEMPKNCGECDLSKRWHSSMGDIIDCKRIGTVGSAFNDPHLILIVRHPDCPLIEIKEPHGRLGDLDKLKRKAQKVSTEAWKMKLTAKIETTINQFIDWLDNTETIVEAE